MFLAEREQTALEHLALCNGERKRQHLLFADYAGELFDERECLNELGEIFAGASNVVVTLDGEKLCDYKEKKKIILHAKVMLVEMQKAGILSKQTHLYIVCTKYDKIKNSDKKDTIIKFVNPETMEREERIKCEETSAIRMVDEDMDIENVPGSEVRITEPRKATETQVVELLQILLYIEDVGRILCMKSFEKLFTRPNGKNYDVYGTEIEYQNMGEDAFTQYDSKKIQYVIYTLFSSTKPRHVRAFQTRLDDELLLVLKSLPDILIQRFSFCTMSYDTRRIKNEEFSYQITDKSNRYKIEKEEIHICEDISMIKNYPLWVNEYYKYMQNHCLYKLHDFMQQYETIYSEFSGYSAMARLYFAVANTENISLEEYFKYADAVKIKCDDYFYKRTVELILDGQLEMFNGKEYEIWDMLERKKIKLKAAYQKILSEKTIKNSPEKIYMILKKYIEGELSISTQKMVEKMIMALKPENLGQVSKMDENICVVLVSQNSNLLLAEEIWKEKIKFQQRILSAGRRDLPDKMLRCLIRKIVKYDKEPISETLYTIYGEKIIPYVYEELYLEAFDKNINIDHWMMLLLKDQKKLMENLVCFSDMGLVQRILLLIDTYQDQNLYALDRENWRKLYKKIKEHGDLSKELAVQFLPVTLKTNYLDDELKQIISPVYEMLKNNTIDFEQWNKIQVLLPEVEAYQSWDRCLRVRIALKNKGCSEIV